MFKQFVIADARAGFLADKSVDLIVTSPPFWKKRCYGTGPGELGQEKRKEDFIKRLTSICAGWKRILKPTGSIFLNLDDTIRNGEFQNIPGLFALACRRHYDLIHHIIWAKRRGMPSPHRSRLAHRSEDIFHFCLPGQEPYINFERFAEQFGESEGTVWTFDQERTFDDHTAPFPLELVKRCAALCLPDGGTLYDPFCGSGTVFRMAINNPRNKTIGSDLKLYERAREILCKPAQYSLF
jgi:DNA modification methylase